MERNIRSTARAVIAAGVLLPFAIGCGYPDGMAGVTGTVRLDGKPLVGATVQFAVQGQPPSWGRTDDHGYYELSRTRAVKGAAIGTNRVKVSTYRDLGDKILPETVSARYNANTELAYEVKPGNNRIDLELTSP